MNSMNPLSTILNGIDAFTMRLLEIHFSLGNIIVLLTAFWLGTLFGRLTRHLTLFKIIIALLIGAFLLNTLPQLHYPIATSFVAGVIAKHSYLYVGIFSWARDISDVLFALRYRRAFEDIRRREEELSEREKRFQDELRAQARASGESAQQKQWREQAKSGRSQQGSSGSGSGGSTGSSQRSGSQSGAGAKDQYLKTLQLNPKNAYSKDELKHAYRKRAKETHPDLGGSDGAFREVNEAYEWLRSSLKG